MNREELKDKIYSILWDKFTPNRRGKWEIDNAVDEIAELLSLPPAEGAEEILEKHLNLQFKDTPEDWTVALIQFNQEKFIAAMQEYATLHAQRIADKMMSERLKVELIRFGKVLRSWGIALASDILECSIDEYLKRREK